jgi:hypothetical protein
VDWIAGVEGSTDVDHKSRGRHGRDDVVVVVVVVVVNSGNGHQPNGQSHRPKQRKNGNWSDQQLEGVLMVVDNGWSVRREVKTYQIPNPSFRVRCYGMPKSAAQGSKGVLSVEERRNKNILSYACVLCMCDMG